MTVNTTWVNPTGATLDLSAGNLVGEVNWDALVSNTYRLGGTDGNAKTGKYQIGTTTSYSNANNTAGLTVNQGAADDEILALKSSDVAHGMTSVTETDTYAKASKHTATNGGLLLTGLGAGQVGTQIDGFSTTTDTARSTSAVAAIYLRAALKSGTSVGTFTGTANSNLLAVSDSASTRMVLDAEGDLHLDATSNINAWDAYDDLALLEAYRVTTAPELPPNYRRQLAEDLEKHRHLLHATGVLTLNEDGHHFVSLKGLLGLLIDAIRQTATRADARLTALESALERKSSWP